LTEDEAAAVFILELLAKTMKLQCALMEKTVERDPATERHQM
jgi:hypothetical protein